MTTFFRQVNIEQHQIRQPLISIAFSKKIHGFFPVPYYSNRIYDLTFFQSFCREQYIPLIIFNQ